MADTWYLYKLKTASADVYKSNSVNIANAIRQVSRSALVRTIDKFQEIWVLINEVELEKKVDSFTGVVWQRLQLPAKKYEIWLTPSQDNSNYKKITSAIWRIDPSRSYGPLILGKSPFVTQHTHYFVVLSSFSALGNVMNKNELDILLEKFYLKLLDGWLESNKSQYHFDWRIV